MDIILCHTTADFDTLGAAVGCAQLQPGSRIVLTGGCHPAVRDFLALHRDEYPLIERRSVNPLHIRSLIVVDAQRRDRLGKAAEWLDLPQVKISVYDHHLNLESDLGSVGYAQIEAVGATTTLIAEHLQAQGVNLNSFIATVMALGIHVDTGSLTFDHTTSRDALALAWLMQQGANVSAIAQYVDPGLSPQLQALLKDSLAQLQTVEVQGYQICRVFLDTDVFVPGLSGLTSRLMDLTESDALLLVAHYCRGEGCQLEDSQNSALSLIARTRIPDTDWNELLQPWGGGGHPRAATVVLRGATQNQDLETIWEAFLAQIPHPPVARDLMSSPVRTIRPETTIDEAQRILLRYGHSGLSVVNRADDLVGIISRRDIDIALHHGFSHAPVKGYMSNQLKTIQLNTPLPEIESMMVDYDVGRLPVLDQGRLVGIVTRTDVLRQLHQSGNHTQKTGESLTPSASSVRFPLLTRDRLQQDLGSPLWTLLMEVATAAESRGWQLYLVGGAVRDLLIAANADLNSIPTQTPLKTLKKTFDDIDLVVDGCHPGAEHSTGVAYGESFNSEAPEALDAHSALSLKTKTQAPRTKGAGVILAEVLCQRYPQARLQVHGRFQTAALLWHQDPVFGSLWVDIATSRTEFYPYPAANPEVEASSLQQDLYRRDFTINALAVRLTPPQAGQVIDFFGGRWDLQAKTIRVLHANSFIEDPTRIYRAVRFAVKLGFEIEPQTEGYIHYAIASGVYNRVQTDLNKVPALQTRLKTELKYILQAPYWRPALQKLGQLGALRCIHPTLELTDSLWQQLRRLERWLNRWAIAIPDPTMPLPPTWQLRLELLLTALSPDLRGRISQQLQLPEDCKARLIKLDEVAQRLAIALPIVNLPSQIVQLLSAEDLPTLLLIAMQLPRDSRRKVWHYRVQWTQVVPLLDGRDLIQMGYQRGPQFKAMLQALKFAHLDHQVATPEDAQRFLLEQFPDTHPTHRGTSP